MRGQKGGGGVDRRSVCCDIRSSNTADSARRILGSATRTAFSATREDFIATRTDCSARSTAGSATRTAGSAKRAKRKAGSTMIIYYSNM
jgi:hypothetical protein